MMHDLHHIFLIHHHAESFPKVFFENRVQVFKRFRFVKTFNILPHHARLSNTWANDGTHRNQICIGIAMQFLQQPTHSRRFDVKAAHTFAGAELSLHLEILFDLFKIVNIDRTSLIQTDQFNRILDMTQPPLAQYIKLVKPPIFRMVHIKMHDRKSFGHQLLGGVIM